jgi:hypothetical protein
LGATLIQAEVNDPEKTGSLVYSNQYMSIRIFPKHLLREKGMSHFMQ